MLDLSREEFKLRNCSSAAEALTIEPEHYPILQEYVVGGTLQYPKDHLDYYRQYEDDDYAPTELVRFQRFRRAFVLDLPVPPRLYSAVVPVQDGLQQRFRTASRNEFSHVRYSPVSCDPQDFVDNDYTLRQALFVVPRRVEICVCITMYNEDEWLLGNTLKAVHDNIRSLQNPSYESPWGEDSWQKIVVCIVSDGRAKINPRTKAMLAALGVYQDLGFRNLDGRDTVAHLFEYTSHASINLNSDGSIRVESGAPDSVPCQTILCLKEKNQKKVNSHRWFLNAVCRIIRPRTCVFLDAGVVPSADALYRLWKPLNDDPTIASTVGSCSALVLPKQWINPILGYQTLEYALTNSLERPVEAILNRRFALNKGGFTAYQYSVVHGQDQDEGIFGSYFSGERNWQNPTVTNANSSLTEDRAIASALLQPGRRVWKTVSVDAAQVVVDVPMTMREFVLQRRRWIDGDFFSTLFDLLHAPSYILRSLTSTRVLGLLVGYVYQAMLLILQYFNIGNCFVVFAIVATSLSDELYSGAQGRNAAKGFIFIYVFLLVSTIVCSLGNPVRSGIRCPYSWICFFWCLLSSYFFIMVLYLLIHGSSVIMSNTSDSQSSRTTMLLTGQLFMFLVWPSILILLIWLISPLILIRKPHSLSSIFWYILFIPVYTNVVTVFAFCNIHDVTWGTMGSDRPELLPSANVLGGRVGRVGRGGNEISTSQDDNGDLIIQGFQNYLDGLDSFLDDQTQLYSQQRVVDPFPTRYHDKTEDYLKLSRTVLLLLWLGLNGALAMIVMNTPSISRFTPTADGGKGLIYVGVVLWAHAGVAVFQYSCTVIYALSLLWGKIRGLVSSKRSKRDMNNEFKDGEHIDLGVFQAVP